MWSYDSDTGTITMTKGDTPTFKIKIMNGEEEYTPTEDDSVILAAKIRGKRKPAFSVEMDTDTQNFVFKESDTSGCCSGKYEYEVSLNNGDFHNTFIYGKKLILLDEVY